MRFNRLREFRGTKKQVAIEQSGVSSGQRRQAHSSPVSVKHWEIIANNLSKAGWSWGCVSAIDSEGRTIWIVDAYRDDGKRFVVCAGEKLRAFLELAIRFGRTPEDCVAPEVKFDRLPR